MNENAESLAILQEAFQGSLDPDIVQMILTESNYIAEDALEKLLALTSVSSTNNGNPCSVNKSIGQSSTVVKDNFSHWNGFEVANGTCTSRIDKQMNKTQFLGVKERNDSQALNLSLLSKSISDDTCSSAALSGKEMLIDSVNKTVSCLSDCTDSENGSAKGNLYLKTKETTTSGIDEFGDSFEVPRNVADTSDPRFTGSFKGLVQEVKFRGSGSAEWSSISKPREVQQDSSLQATINSKDHNKPKEIIDSRFDLNSNHGRTNLGTTMHHLNTEMEVTDQPLSSNGLPPWPDHQQGYLHQVQPFQNFYNYGNQRFSIPHNFSRKQNHKLTGNGTCLHSMPQYQLHQNLLTNNPDNQSCTSNAFYVPDPQNPPIGWHPGQSSKSAGNKRLRIPQGNEKAFLMHDKVLVILRGLPGSGKTTLAKNLKGDGIILSTDDYFIINGQYQYKRNALAEAHEWNKNRAQESMQRGVSPVIIDNTNTQAWEIRPYVSMAQSFGYWVILKEPDTPWKWDTKELVKRSQHNIPLSTIQYMNERYEKGLTIERILASSLEKQKVPSILQTGHFNNMETQKRNRELKVIHNERNCKPNIQCNFAEESSLASDINRDGSYIGIDNKKQRANEEHQSKSSVASSNLASNQLGNQRETKMFHHSKPNVRPDTLRSHGSRSPIQDMDFSLPDFSKFSKAFAEENDTVNAKENLMETLQPKQQRIPKKRERKSARSPLRMQKKEDDEDPNIFLDFDEGKDISLGVKEQKLNENTGNSVKSILDYKENVQPFKIELAEVENTLSNTASHDCTQNSTTEECMPEEAHIRETISKDLTKKKSARPSKSESDTDEAPDEDDDVNGYSISRKNDGISSSRLGTDFAETNDLNESFKTLKIPDELWNSRGEKEEESVHENLKCESEQSGFQFLNTCFPDIDVEILLDFLANEQGDVTQVVENILRHEESHSRVQRNPSKEATSTLKSFLKPSIPEKYHSKGRSPTYSLSDQNWKSSKGHFQETETETETLDRSPQSYPGHVAHDQSSFQMMLEPPVALHLLELFGPIDNVNLEGDFSTDSLIVEVDSDFAKSLYNQWRTTVKSNKEKLFSTGDVQKQSQVLGKKESLVKRSKKQHKKYQPQDNQERRQPGDFKQIMDEQLALEQSMQEQEHPDNSRALLLKRKQLYSTFPGVDPLALEEIFEANRYEFEPTVSMVEASCNLQGKPFEIKEIGEGRSQSVPQSDSLKEQKVEYQVLQDPDYVDFRAEANTHYKQREECFRKAAFAFSKKQGQLAQFYASQGHMHTEKIREANKRAADKILEFKNSEGNQNSLDLHGLHVNEALLALEERLHFPGSSKNQSSFLSVITGQGKHSKQGKAKIKPAVLEYLQRNNYRFEEPQPGLVRVSLFK